MRLKKTVFLSLIMSLIALLTACGDSMSNYNIEGEHRFYDITMFEALELLDDEAFSGILYFGFPGCPFCQEAVPAMHEASQAIGVDIFYVSRQLSIRETEGWEEADAAMAWWLNEQVELGWLYDDNEDPIRPNIFVPHVVYIRNGIVIDSHQGTFEGHERLEDGSLPELTDEEYATLLEIYTRIFSAFNASEMTN